MWRRLPISIHTPHAGSDVKDGRAIIKWKKFQSTLPMRGATTLTRLFMWCIYNFNPHSPCGERRPALYRPLTTRKISIHTPHAGSDHSTANVYNERNNFNPHSPCGERRFDARTDDITTEFQSTLPMRVATCTLYVAVVVSYISIHTPHAGSDI